MAAAQHSDSILLPSSASVAANSPSPSAAATVASGSVSSGTVTLPDLKLVRLTMGSETTAMNDLSYIGEIVHHPLPVNAPRSHCSSPLTRGSRAPPPSASTRRQFPQSNTSNISSPATRISFSLDTKISIEDDKIGSAPATSDSNHSDNTNGLSTVLKSKRHHQIASLVDVCPECLQLLFKAYNHCISGKGALFGSPKLIHEEEDMRPHTHAPEYIVVSEPPLIGNNPDMVNQKEQVRFDRRARSGARARQEHQQNLVRVRSPSAGQRHDHVNNNENRVSTIESGDRFSGTLYKQVLSAKNIEIDRLRKQLYHTKATGERETENVHRLQKALKKSLLYYTQAEHWQEEESSELVEDVRQLKSEISVLLAVMISEESCKQNLTNELMQARQYVLDKNKDLERHDLEMQRLKTQLHEAYKDFLAMNDSIKVLQIEAQEGSAAVKNKNDVLQCNLDQVSRDFDTVSRRLIVAQDRIRLLEFELKEVVTQFNDTGDSKSSLEATYTTLLAQHQTLSSRANFLESTYGKVVQQRDQLESELRQSKEVSATALQSQQTKIDTLAKQYDTEHMQKYALETQLEQLKGENEKLRSTAIELRFNKTELESTIQKLKETQFTDLSYANKQMEHYKTVALSATEQLHQIAESKEKLLLQVTDLRNNLERERARSTLLDGDYKKHKKNTAEQHADFEDQINKLTVLKNTLIGDKKELMDSVREARRDLVLKKNEYIDLEEKMRKLTVNKEKEVNELHANIHSLQDALDKLTGQHATLVNTHDKFMIEHIQVEEQYTSTKTDLNRTCMELVAHRKTIAELSDDKKMVEDERDLTRKQLYEKIGHCDKVTAKLRETERLRNQMQTELTGILQNKEELLRELTEQHTALRISQKDLQAQLEQYQRMHANTVRDLKLARDALLEESASRSILEMTTDELRVRFENEKKTRIEFERLHVKLEKKVGEWVGQRLQGWTDREKVWEGVEDWVSKELNRMDDVIGILGIREGIDT